MRFEVFWKCVFMKVLVEVVRMKVFGGGFEGFLKECRGERLVLG